MRLSRLAERLEDACSLVSPASAGGTHDVEVRRLCFDSRAVRPGDLFAALPGTAVDGRRFVADALGRGAVAVLGAGLPRSLTVPVLALKPGAHPAETAGRAAALVAGDPSRTLWVGAVTGTNGKTTVVHLLEQALRHAGRRPARCGTLGMAFEGQVEAIPNTTPAADRLQDWLGRVRVAGADSLVLEASSHALDQRRLAGLRIAAAGWTNLTQDHLDYHADLTDYAAAKARLVHGLPAGAPAFVPVTAPLVGVACRGAAAQLVPWSLDRQDAALRGRIVGHEDGLRVAVEGEWGEAELRSPLIGRHNAENLLLAFGLLRAAGLEPAAAAAGLAAAGAAPGRLQRVAEGSPWPLFVDYAHTPDALVRVLDALREAYPGRRLGVVFGAGGDRDRGKRPQMGEAAARGADWCLVTSDNPRTEDPARIVEEVAAGARDRGCPVALEVDRREAIRRAVAGLAPGDVLLVAGKGHEDYQEVAGVRHPFDDRLELEEAARCSV